MFVNFQHIFCWPQTEAFYTAIFSTKLRNQLIGAYLTLNILNAQRIPLLRFKPMGNYKHIVLAEGASGHTQFFHIHFFAHFFYIFSIYVP